MSDLLPPLQAFVKELRNGRDTDANWRAFQAFVAANEDEIVGQLPLRWLRSICDTYADFGDAVARRDGLAISMFINMVRFAESVRYLRGPIDETRLAEMGRGRIPLYDELWTFHLHKQDVFLNLSKRMTRQLQGSGLMEKIWREVLRRLHAGHNVITELRDLSQMPERYFPLDPLAMADNYGVV